MTRDRFKFIAQLEQVTGLQAEQLVEEDLKLLHPSNLFRIVAQLAILLQEHPLTGSDYHISSTTSNPISKDEHYCSIFLPIILLAMRLPGCQAH